MLDRQTIRSGAIVGAVLSAAGMALVAGPQPANAAAERLDDAGFNDRALRERAGRQGMSPGAGTAAGGIPPELPAGKRAAADPVTASEPDRAGDAGFPDAALRKRLERSNPN